MNTMQNQELEDAYKAIEILNTRLIERREAYEDYIAKQRIIGALIDKVRQWGIEKGITGPEGKGTLYSQAEKMTEEANETMEAVASYNRASLNCDQWEMDRAKPEIIDGIGDTAVTLILLAEILGVPFEQCLQAAYVVISKRTGKMIDGTFVRDK